MCEIACWRGYVTWQFFVESESLQERAARPHRTSVRPAREHRSRPRASLAAHAALVEKLVAAGWEPEGYGEEWFAESFQRAGSASA